MIIFRFHDFILFCVFVLSSLLTCYVSALFSPYSLFFLSFSNPPPPLSLYSDAYGERLNDLNTAKSQLSTAKSTQTSKATAQSNAQSTVNTRTSQRNAAQLAYDTLVQDDETAALLKSIEQSIDSIFTLHEASFNVSLSLADGGAFNVFFDLTFFGHRKQFTLHFNFKDIGAAISSLFDYIFTGEFLANLGIGVKALNAQCSAHHECAGFGPGTTAVACCPTATSARTCQKKVADWAGVGYCTRECVGQPFGSPGTCGTYPFPRLLNQPCTFHTDCKVRGGGKKKEKKTSPR